MGDILLVIFSVFFDDLVGFVYSFTRNRLSSARFLLHFLIVFARKNILRRCGNLIDSSIRKFQLATAAVYRQLVFVKTETDKIAKTTNYTDSAQIGAYLFTV